MAVTVRDGSANDRLERLTELADAVLEAAHLLQVTAVAARGSEAEPDAAVSRAERCGALIEDLLAHEALDPREVARRAAELGCDLTLGAVVVCVELHVPRPAFVAALIADGCDEALVHTQEADGREEPEAARVYAVLPCTGSCVAGSVGAVRGLSQRLAPYGIVGVSSYQAQPGELGRALREAEIVLQLIRHSGERIAEEVGSGTYRLMLRMLATHPEEVREFYETTVAPMVRYDAEHQTELVATLRAYLEADCNMNVTASAVFAHRHTISARLDRIRELTGLDPLRYEDRERLGLGLKAHRLLAPQLEP